MPPFQTLRQWVGVAIQLGVGGLFVYAGMAKWLDPLRFASSLLGYQVFPMAIIYWIVWLFPWVEVGVGVAMILGVYPRVTGGAVVALLTVFTLLVSYAYTQNLVIDCGCFGAPRPVNGQKILENLAMMMAAYAWWKHWVPSVSLYRLVRRKGR